MDEGVGDPAMKFRDLRHLPGDLGFLAGLLLADLTPGSRRARTPGAATPGSAGRSKGLRRPRPAATARRSSAGRPPWGGRATMPDESQKSSGALARYRQLVGRAMSELKLAQEAAAAVPLPVARVVRLRRLRFELSKELEESKPRKE